MIDHVIKPPELKPAASCYQSKRTHFRTDIKLRGVLLNLKRHQGNVECVPPRWCDVRLVYIRDHGKLDVPDSRRLLPGGIPGIMRGTAGPGGIIPPIGIILSKEQTQGVGGIHDSTNSSVMRTSETLSEQSLAMLLNVLM